MTLKVNGEVEGTSVAIDWAPANGTITTGGTPFATKFSLTRNPAGQYPDSLVTLTWTGPVDFEGSLPVSGAVNPGNLGGTLDVGNCAWESRVWHVDKGSYVFELSDLRSRAIGTDPSVIIYCGGAARAGTLLGCLIDARQ